MLYVPRKELDPYQIQQKQINEALSYKWDSGLTNQFNSNFKIGDYISIKKNYGGDYMLAKVKSVADNRIWCTSQKQGRKFFITPSDTIKRGFYLYELLKREKKESEKQFHQEKVNEKCNSYLDGDSMYERRNRRKRYQKLIPKKVEEEPVDYHHYDTYNYNSSSLNSLRGKSTGGGGYSGYSGGGSYPNTGRVKEEQEPEHYEVRIITEQEYQILVEKMAYKKYLNQLIKTEKIDIENKNIKSSSASSVGNGKNNGKKQVKTFEISDKRIKRFAMKFLKPEDLKKIEEEHKLQQQQQQKQHQQQSNLDEYGNQQEYQYEQYVDPQQQNEYYQEETYYIEPEQTTFDYNSLNNYENFENDNDGYEYYDDQDHDEDDNGEDDGSNYGGYGEDDNYQESTTDKLSLEQRSDSIHNKLIVELQVYKNQDYLDDFQKLSNTFNSGYILHHEFHIRRMDLLRDYFNIDLSKYILNK